MKTVSIATSYHKLPEISNKMFTVAKTVPVFAPMGARANVARSSRRASIKVRVIDENAPPQKKLTRESEPEEYWTSESEKNPMGDPLAYIGILAILFPFIFVAIAIATGAIDTTGSRGF